METPQGKEQVEPRAGGPPVPDRSSGGQRPRAATTWCALQDHQPPWMKEGWMFDHYLALRSPEQSGLLAWSALPHAPVLSDKRPRRPAGRLRRGTARRLFGLAQRLDPQAGRLGPDRVPAPQAPAC